MLMDAEAQGRRGRAFVMDAPPREAFDGTSLSKQSLSREIAMGRIREALEKAGIRATQAGYAHG